MEQHPQNEFNPYAAPTEAPAHPLQVFGSQQTLDKVAAGFNLVFWGQVVMLVYVLFMLFVAFSSGRGLANGNLGTLEGLQAIAVVAIVIQATYVILDVIGKCMCLAVPSATRSRELIIASVVCLGIWVLMVLLVIAGIRNVPILLVQIVANALNIIFFLLFIKRIGEFMSRRDLADRAQTTLVLLIIMYATLILGMLLAFSQIANLGLFALLGITLLVLSIIFVVMYLRLLLDSRKGILGIY